MPPRLGVFVDGAAPAAAVGALAGAAAGAAGADVGGATPAAPAVAPGAAGVPAPPQAASKPVATSPVEVRPTTRSRSRRLSQASTSTPSTMELTPAYRVSPTMGS